MPAAAPTAWRAAWPERLGPVAGIVGSASIAVVSLVAALAYTGTQGEGYSPLSHWVSELGETGVSAQAAVFNLGLLVGGAGFATFMAGLSVVRTGQLAAVFGALGIASGISVVLVGLLPLGQSNLHVVAAAGYFLLGGVAIALASVDLWRRPDAAFPAWLGVVGGIVVACIVGFVVVSGGRGGFSGDGPRPGFLLEPTLEWSAIIGNLLWTTLVAMAWRRGRATVPAR